MRGGFGELFPRLSAVKVPLLPRSVARDLPGLPKAKCAKTLFQSAVIPPQKGAREFGAVRFEGAEFGRVAAKAGCVECGEYRNAARCFRSHSSARPASRT